MPFYCISYPQLDFVETENTFRIFTDLAFLLWASKCFFNSSKITIVGPPSPLNIVPKKREEKSSKNQIFIQIKHSMVVENDA